MRIADKNDRSMVSSILLQAFADDPCINWIVDPSTNPHRVERMVDYIVDEALCNGTVYITKNNDGVALWMTEKKEKISFRFFRRNILLWIKNGSKSVRRALLVQKLGHQDFPNNKPILYLYMIGVSPHSQGKGVATRLLEPVLAQNKAKGIPVYLDTANPRNVEIYRKKGFEVYRTHVADDLKIWFMKYR